MDLWDFVKVLFRRWYLTVPLLALTALAAGQAGQGVQPTYTASASGVFLEPPVTIPIDQLSPNPWATAGVATTAAATIDSVVDPVTKSKVVADGYSGEYTVLLASRSVLFTVFAPAPSTEGATRTLDHVITLMQDDLSAKQARYKVPANQRILIQVTTGKSLVTTRDGLKQVLLGVGGLGVVLTAAIVITVDSLLARRRRRRAADGDGGDGDGEPLDEPGADDDGDAAPVGHGAPGDHADPDDDPEVDEDRLGESPVLAGSSPPRGGSSRGGPE